MAKAKKLTKDELKSVNEVVGRLNQAKMALAESELQKLDIVNAINKLKQDVIVQQKALEDKYGKVSVNLSTGEITPEDEQADS